MRLKSSEIGLMHEVQVDGQWITVEKFIALTAPRPAGPKTERQVIAPPALPSRVDEAAPRSPGAPARSMPQPEKPLKISEVPRETSPLENAPADSLAYAGFWLRVVAATIDTVFLGAIAWAFGALAVMVAGGMPATLPPWLGALVVVLAVLGGWLYGALMESSEVQATLGKLATGLIVTDRAGARPTFGRASGRYFGKLLSVLTAGAGFFLAAFTPRKQAFHDLLAGCHVLLRLPAARIFSP